MSNKVSRRSVIKGLAAMPAATFLPAFSSHVFAGAHDIYRDNESLLLGRTSYGINPASLEEIRNLGVVAYLEQQLNPEGINDGVTDTLCQTHYPLILTTPTVGSYLWSLSTVMIDQCQKATLFLAMHSKRQLFEVMVDFWTDHFNIHDFSHEGMVLKVVDDREVIRKHAMTTFPELLSASAHSPAMLTYLNNSESTKDRPNENYARELMELHTMGEGRGYTHQDIIEVARCFSGWRLDLSFGGVGNYMFDATLHDDGAKTVLGHHIPAGGGKADGETVLRILSEHPMTASFIARKLVTRFVSDAPPEPLVDRVADTYLSTGGDIRSMLRVILTSSEFYASAGLKYKRPKDFVISVVRAFQPVAVEVVRNEYVEAITKAGQYPFMWPTPDGYRDQASYWLSANSVTWLMKFAVMHAEASSLGDLLKVGATPNNRAASVFGKPTTYSEMIDTISDALLGTSLPADLKNILTDFVSRSGTSGNPDEAELVAMAPAVAIGVMSTPYFWQR